MNPNQCPSTTVDRATDEETRCVLTIGHKEQRHTDGCLTWGDAVMPRPAIRIEPTPHRWVCFVDGRPENWYGETPELALQAMRDGTNEPKENDDAT